MLSSRAGSALSGFRFPPEVICLAVRWYLRFTPEFTEAARPCRHAPGNRRFAGEACVTAAGRWTCPCRAAGQHGQVTGVLLPGRRDLAARRFFTRALRADPVPA